MIIRIIKNINGIDYHELKSFIDVNQNGNFFQSFEAFEFFASVDTYNPLLILAIENEEIIGSLLAFVIRGNKLLTGYLSRRCIVYGGPIVKDKDPEIVNKLVSYLDNEVSGKAIFSEFRILYDMKSYKEVFNSNGYVFEDHLNYIVPIISAEENRKLLHTSKRRQINLSIKNGAEIREAKSLADIERFYKILSNLYRTKVKKPLPEFNFFTKFYNNKKLGKIFLIKFKEEIIGGIMCPIYRDKIFEWFVCGLDGKVKNVYPSVLATWAPIEYGINNGLKYFDFLGAGKPNIDYGVRDFKSKFGGQLVNYGRFTKIHSKTLYNIGKSGLQLIKKIR
jgi:serine/alanine adding enzyme